MLAELSREWWSATLTASRATRVATNSVQHNGIGPGFDFDKFELRTVQEEYRLMKKLLMVVAVLTFSLALFAPLSRAKTAPVDTVAQDPAKEEADAYAAWYTAYKAQDAAKTLELGKAFVQKFPTSKYADFIKKDFAREYGILFNEAVKAKNTAEIIRVGREVLASDPDNLDYLTAISIQIRQNELFATPPNFAHAAEAAEFTERAIRLLEAGKIPTGADPAKFNKNVTLAYFHQTLAVIYEHDKNVDKALAEYDKAAVVDNTNAAYFFQCGRIHNDKYAAAAQKYDALQKKVDAIPDADRNAAEPKPEVKAAMDEAKAALAEVNSQADAVINCWARFLGLTAQNNQWGETRGRIEKALTDLYKYRHNDSTDGLQKLIDQNRPAPANSNNTPSAAVKP
jgi:hypothetical protein